MDRNGTTAGSENGAEINSEPTTSTDANRQADLLWLIDDHCYT